MAILLDELFARLGYQYDNSGFQRFERGIAAARRRLDGISRLATRAGAAITAAAVAPVVSFATYETEMAKIEGLVGISRDQLNAWQGDIARIAEATGKGPDELAKSLFFITSAGLRGETALQALEMAAKASAAGMGEADDIADLLTSAIGVYGEGALSAQQATDQLTAAIREGKIEPRELGPALAGVLPFANELGISFGESAGALAAMSRQGIEARRGATSLRGIMGKLLKPTEAGKKALEGMGISMEDIHKEIKEKGLLSALRTLRTAFGDNKEAAGKVFEDQEALLGFYALTGAKANENAEIIRNVTAANGTLDEALAAVARTFNFQWKRGLAVGKSALIALGERLAPVAKKVGNFATDTIKWLRDLDPWFQDLLAYGLMLGPVLLGAGLALKALSFALGGLVPIMSGVVWASRRMRRGILWSTRNLGSATRAGWDGLSTAASGSFQAIRRAKRRLDATLAFAGVRGVAAATFAPFRTAAVRAFRGVRAAAFRGYGGVRAAARLSVSPITGVYDAVRKHGVFGSMRLAAERAFRGVRATGRLTATSLKGTFSVVSAAARLMWLAIGGPVGTAIGAGALAVIAAWKPVSTFFKGLWEGITSAFGGEEVYDEMGIAHQAPSRISRAFQQLKDNLGPVGDAIETVSDGISTAFSAVVNLFDDQSDAGKGFGSAIVDGIASAIESLNSLIQWFKDFSISDTIKNAFDFDLSLPGPLRRLLGLDDPDGDAAAKATGKKTMDAVAAGAKEGSTGLIGAIENAAQRVRDFFGSSDAKIGPLSDITAAGRKTMEAFGRGAASVRPLQAALAAGALALPPTAQLLAPLPVGPPAVPPAAYGQAGNTVSVEINFGQGSIVVQASGSDPNDVAEQVADAVVGKTMRALTEELDSQVEA